MRRELIATAIAFSLLLLAAPAASMGHPTETERSILRTVNTTRTARGLPAVRFASPLQARAHRYALRLLRTNRFEHSALPPRTRENLAWATTNMVGERTFVRVWMTSPAHRRTLLWRVARRAGVGAARGSYRGYADVLVVVLRLRP